jgi:hypothetical protein
MASKPFFHMGKHWRKYKTFIGIIEHFLKANCRHGKEEYPRVKVLSRHHIAIADNCSQFGASQFTKPRQLPANI